MSRALAELVFSISSVVGVILGFVWASHHQYVARGQQCHGPMAGAAHRAAHGALGHCLGSTLGSALTAWIIPIAVGAVAGMFVGVAIPWGIRLALRPLLAR